MCNSLLFKVYFLKPYFIKISHAEKYISMLQNLKYIFFNFENNGCNIFLHITQNKSRFITKTIFELCKKNSIVSYEKLYLLHCFVILLFLVLITIAKLTFYKMCKNDLKFLKVTFMMNK